MTKMQNDELRRKIGKVELEVKETSEKRIKVNYNIDNVYNDLFVYNDTLKLYDKTIVDLSNARDIERTCLNDIRQKVGEFKRKIQDE